MDQRYKITKMKILMLILNFILVGAVLDCNASELSNKTTIMRHYQEYNCVSEDGLVNDLLNLKLCNINNIFKCKDNYIKDHLKGITICEM